MYCYRLAIFRKMFVAFFSLSVTLTIPFNPSVQSVNFVSPHIPFQKGMCYATWNKDQFASSVSDKALALLEKAGVEYVQINVTQYQDSFNSTKIRPTSSTPSDKSVRHAIKEAHDLGLSVMLKPHVDLIKTKDGTWRGDIGFQNDKDWNTWFKEYEKFITQYAMIAEKNDVEIFCVGTELSFTTQKTEKWNEIINKVRNIYSGKLVYAANWDNYQHIKFWDKLDAAGIDAYFPVSYSSSPSSEEIKKGWQKWCEEIESWNSSVNKPVIFTEIGYASTPNAASEPWRAGEFGNADLETQAKCYEAFFETVWNKDWLSGVYWWRFAPTVYGGGKSNRRFTPLNKPAFDILSKNYKHGRMLEKKFESVKTLSQKLDILDKKSKTRSQVSPPKNDTIKRITHK